MDSIFSIKKHQACTIFNTQTDIWDYVHMWHQQISDISRKIRNTCMKGGGGRAIPYTGKLLFYNTGKNKNKKGDVCLIFSKTQLSL